MRPIVEVAAELGLATDEVMACGDGMAKIRLPALPAPGAAVEGKLILVSAINPTRAGEGKTTLSIGLAQGLRRLGKRSALALREPSLGPIFGVKGGGTGGGRCRLEPGTRINMHFTGDIHAVGAAHNLLAAIIDNTIHHHSGIDLEHRQLFWRRVLDVNDRALRHMVIGLGGRSHGVPREAAFDITAASEVMAILALHEGIDDLKQRLGSILVGYDRDGAPVTAATLEASGAMAALLYDAMLPNLVQSNEGVAALVHAGPFGNIAHGCNSVVATRTAAQRADYVVTEAGFGFDLGAEKFFDIKCRSSGLWPSAVVLVVTTRALRIHGGGSETEHSLEALQRGLIHLDHHVRSVQAFGFAAVIALNVFDGDSEAELAYLEAACDERGLRCARFSGYRDGGEGAIALAEQVLQATAQATPPARFLYELAQPPEEKIAAVAHTIYGAGSVVFSRSAEQELERIRALGFDKLPICIAKTHLSLSADPRRVGSTDGFSLPVESLRVAAGAGYLLALTGDIVTMPGLPRTPAASSITLDKHGLVRGI